MIKDQSYFQKLFSLWNGTDEEWKDLFGDLTRDEVYILISDRKNISKTTLDLIYAKIKYN